MNEKWIQESIERVYTEDLEKYDIRFILNNTTNKLTVGCFNGNVPPQEFLDTINSDFLAFVSLAKKLNRFMEEK